MSKTIITAELVHRAVSAGRLVIPEDAIVTPLAKDRARELGVAIVVGAAEPAATTPTNHEDEELVAQVRSLVTSLLGAGGGVLAPTATRPQAVHVDARSAKLQPFGYAGPPPGMQVETVDVITAAEGSPVTAGYMSITEGVFPWKLDFDELQIVLEGELRLGGDAGGKVGRPGDVLFVPKGSQITFETDSWAKFVYITYPANWEDQIK